ncbi:MAG: hypothetical protein ACUVXI_16720 [bacterium]
MGKFSNSVLGLILFIAISVCAYLLATSFEAVGPRKVNVVREIGFNGSQAVLKSRPLVNEGDTPKLFPKQPKIPLTGIGYDEKTIDIDEVKNFTTSFALYTTDEKTGDKDDKEYVQAYTIEGKVKRVTDWDKFISLLDVDQINYESRNSPFARKYKDRVEIIADQLKIIARSGSTEDPFGNPLTTEDGKRLMNLKMKIDYWQNELISRRNFVIALKDKFGFKEEKEFRNFIENEAPWYHVLGVSAFESLANQAKEISEYTHSIYSRDLTPKGSDERYIPDEDYLTLINYAGRAYAYERTMEDIRESLDQTRNRREETKRGLDGESRRLAEAVSRSYKASLERRGKGLIDMSSEDLGADFTSFIRGEIVENLAGALRFDQLGRDREELLEYEASEIPQLKLSEKAKSRALEIVEDLKKAAKEKFQSEIWEADPQNLTKLFNEYLSDHPELRFLGTDIVRFASFKFVKDYLDGLYERMRKYKDAVTSEEALKSMYDNLKDAIGAKDMNRDQLYNMIQSYLTDRSKILQSAQTLVGLDWQDERAKGLKHRWEIIKREELMPFFEHQKTKVDMEESDALWNAAIKDALMGEDLSKYRPYVIHRVDRNETLEGIAKRYKIDGLGIFKASKNNLEFSNPEHQGKFDSILFKEGDEKVYDFAKNLTLKVDSQVTIPTYERFTPQWWEKQEEFQKKRDMVMKRYIYPWIEEQAPKAFDKYIHETPYLGYLQRTYGVELDDIKLSIQTRNLYSNPQTRQVDQDFYDVYEFKLRNR